MARSVLEIYNSLVARKQSFTELLDLTPQYVSGDNPYQLLLDELSSSSKVSIWRLWLFLVAVGHYTLEVMMDAFIAEAEDISKRNAFGTKPWYGDKLLAFQYGYTPVFDSSKYTYEYADTTSSGAIASRIINKVSVKVVKNMVNNTILMKVATETAPNTFAPISAPQLVAVDSYIDRIKPPGEKTQIQSFAGDLFRGNFKAWYDGTLIAADFQTAFEDTLKLFLKNIPFDGVLHIDDLIVALKKIPGLVNIQVVGVDVKAAFDPTFQTVSENYNPASGWFEVVPFGTTPTDSNIELIAV